MGTRQRDRWIIYLPFTLMLSPRCASVRISAQSEIVREVPPPPLALVSRGSRDVTAGEQSVSRHSRLPFLETHSLLLRQGR